MNHTSASATKRARRRTSVNGPDFICIGMPKAGTRWLYDQLSHHPDFWMPPGKELQYLDRDFPGLENFRRHLENWPKFVRSGQRNGFTWGKRELAFLRDIVTHAGQPMDIRRYAGLFRHKRNLLSGDITPGYCALEDEYIGEIAAGLPQTRIILLVREPISRAWSRICMAERDGQFDVSLLDDPSKFAGFLRESRYITRYFATRIIRQWSRHYPSDAQFRVILFDDIVRRSGETLREILAFVGADPSRPSRLPTDYNRKSSDRKLRMPDPIRNVLAEYFQEEVRVYSALLAGAPRESWPSLMAPRSNRRASRSVCGRKESREALVRSLFTATSRFGSASHRLFTRSWRFPLPRARHGRAMKRRNRQVIAFWRRAARDLVRLATAPIPVVELLIDAKLFVVNVLIRECPVYQKRTLQLPQRS